MPTPLAAPPPLPCPPRPASQPPRQLSTHGDVRLPRRLPSFHGSRYVSCSTWLSGPPVSPQHVLGTLPAHRAASLAVRPARPTSLSRYNLISQQHIQAHGRGPASYHSPWLRADQDRCDVSCLAHGTARGANLLSRWTESPRLTSVSSHSKGSKSVPESSNSCT